MVHSPMCNNDSSQLEGVNNFSLSLKKKNFQISYKLFTACGAAYQLICSFMVADEDLIPSSMLRNEWAFAFLLAAWRLWFSKTAFAEECTSRSDICTLAIVMRSSSPTSQASDVWFSKSWKGSRLLFFAWSSLRGELATQPCKLWNGSVFQLANLNQKHP